MQRSSLVSRAVHCMASVGGKAVALCKEQKDLAVLYGLMPLSAADTAIVAGLCVRKHVTCLNGKYGRALYVLGLTGAAGAVLPPS